MDPTSKKFDPKVWSHLFDGSLESDKDYMLSGLIIGEEIAECDKEYNQLIEKFGQLSEKDVIWGVLLTISHFVLSEKPTNADAMLEALCDAASTLLFAASGESKNIDSKIVMNQILPIATKRIYLKDVWSKVRDFGWSITNCNISNALIFESSEPTLDLGQIIGVARFGDHLKQLYVLGFQNDEFFVEKEIKKIPQSLSNKNQKYTFQYTANVDNIAALNYMAMVQVPFYFCIFENVKFKNFPILTQKDIRHFWVLLQYIGQLIYQEIILHKFVEKNYFTKEVLIELCMECITNCNEEKAIMLVDYFSQSKSSLSDFWLKPIFKIGNEYYLIFSTLLSGQFLIINDDAMKNEIKDFGVLKGNSFELEVAKALEKQIENNPLLDDRTCKVITTNYKETKGRKNQEIDIIIRIGCTYLLIEAKSFVFKTNRHGYNQNLDVFLKSKIQDKKAAFIKDYERFKSLHDKTADFKLKETNVQICYLSSLPHAVGNIVNGAPIVDMSILERYFGDGHTLLISPYENRPQPFYFYKSSEQAERNLMSYLINPPNMNKYRDNFSFSINRLISKFKGKTVRFQDPVIRLNDETELEAMEKLYAEKDTWCEKA